MSLKRILGTMLATRMAGRGRRRGALGTASMLGLGRRRRRPGMGGMGIAALGYMAYRAYQDHQSKTAGTTSAGASGGAGSAGATGQSGTPNQSGGGIAGMVQDVVDRLSGGSQSASREGGTHEAIPSGAATTGAAAAGTSEQDMHEEAQAADSLSDRTALLLIRAMITAAYSDGAMSTEERLRIMGEIDEAGGDPEDREVMEREIANPKPLDELLAEVNDPETAEEFYLASRAAVDGETEANRAYLAELRTRLDLSDEQVAEAEEMAS